MRMASDILYFQHLDLLKQSILNFLSEPSCHVKRKPARTSNHLTEPCEGDHGHVAGTTWEIQARTAQVSPVRPLHGEDMDNYCFRALLFVFFLRGGCEVKAVCRKGRLLRQQTRVWNLVVSLLLWPLVSYFMSQRFWFSCEKILTVAASQLTHILPASYSLSDS